MQQATITVQYVNQPKGPRGPGSIKDTEGNYWKVWPTTKKPGGATLDSFAVGGTYSIGYDPGEYQGKPDNTITSVTQTAAPATNGHKLPPRQETAPTDAERMFCCSILNASIQAGKIDFTTTGLIEAVNDLRSVWKYTFGADQ